MEPPTGFWASIWNFVCFLPFFVGLWLLGNIKGVIFCPLVCLVMTIGNSAIIHGLWPIHCIWTYYCVVRSKKLGPALKFVTCTCILPLVLILWPVAGIVGSVIGGAAYGFFAPIFATFEAVEGGKENKLFHCFIDGTWSTIRKTFDIVKDVKNECYDSYFSFMDDLLQLNGKYYEIRLRYLPGAIVAAVLGIIIDMPVISVVAIFKGPYMLFKGWKRLFHDLMGREGPFLETICVPFAGLAIVLWPLAVVGAVLASVLASSTLHFWAPTNPTAQKPSLVLIHGFGPESIWQWRKQVQFLAPHFNVYVPDLIFFGGSSTKSSERSETFQAASVGKLLDKLEVEKFHVVGTSYGGMVAYNLAKMLGEDRVQKVVIASSGVNMIKSSNVALVQRAQLEKIEDLMLPPTPQHLRILMKFSIHKPPQLLPDFLLRDFLAKLYGENRKEKMELLKGLTVGRDDTSRISPLQQEVLIVWGEEDRIFPLKLAHELKEIISKKARLELIKEASHVPQMEKPREFNNILLNFLQEHS